MRGLKVYGMEDLPAYLRDNAVDVAVLTIPKENAQAVAGQLYGLGVRAFWNFAHVDLALPDDARVENVEYVTEYFNGEETTFALNPDGTVYIIPSTAGTKRYAVNDDAIDPIHALAEAEFSTRDRGGMFAAVEIEGGRLVYKAYLVDDETGEVTAEDVFAVKKTAAGAADPSRRDQSFFSTVYAGPVNFLVAFFKMMVDYVKLLTQVIGR